MDFAPRGAGTPSTAEAVVPVDSARINGDSETDIGPLTIFIQPSFRGGTIDVL